METRTINIPQLRRRYNRLESNNDHNAAAMLLVMAFGTKDQQDTIKAITERCDKLGYIEPADYELRYVTANKYHKLLYLKA